MVQEIRHELFAFPEVLDVFVTGRPDCLVVVSLGRPRPGEWLRALRAVGYQVPIRRHATQASEANRQGPAGPARAPGAGLTARAHGGVPDCAPAMAVLGAAVPAGKHDRFRPPGRTERSIVAGLLDVGRPLVAPVKIRFPNGL
jgi:hypothetical protein